MAVILQETSSLQSGVGLRVFSHMNPVQEFRLAAGTILLLLLAVNQMLLLTSMAVLERDPARVVGVANFVGWQQYGNSILCF